MNIGIDIKALKNVSTGINKYIRCILDELQLIDSENRYYLFECEKSDYTPTNPNWNKFSQSWKLPGTVWLQLIVPTLIKKHKIDVFWAAEQICPAFWVRSGTKIITTIYDFTARRFPDTCQTSVLLIHRLLLSSTIKKSAALAPISDYIKKELTDFFPHAQSTSKIIKTVSPGTKDFDPATPSAERENFLFFPGNLEPRKNLLRLIKALEIVNASGFELDLRICGPKGWKNTDFYESIKSSPEKNRIKHLGYLSDADILNQYRACKALIFPSVYEGFGMPVLEALSLNTPVLTSKGTVMEEIAGESAMYFDPYSADSIAATVIAFLKTGGPPINHNSINRYTWKQSAKALLELFLTYRDA